MAVASPDLCIYSQLEEETKASSLGYGYTGDCDNYVPLVFVILIVVTQ